MINADDLIQENSDNINSTGEIKRDKWLQLAQEAYRESTDYMESSLRKQRETDYAMFRSKHPPGSKYYTDAYKFRSKIFRPKTRGAIRRNEAAAAMAYFATQDVVTILPENDADPFMVASAKLQHEIMNYRLEHSIPWFRVLIGAYQESMVIGTVASKQYWEYEERVETVHEPVIATDGLQEVDEKGNLVFEEIEKVTVLKDRPVISLIPPENLRYSPAANWLDPINTSPYVIELIPMYVGDIKERMKRDDPKTGQPKWFYHTDGEILSAKGFQYDSTRQARDGTKRQDPMENNSEVLDFNIRWVHENHIREEGRDMVYYTLGTEYRLTEPVPVEEIYLHGMRPYTLGVSQIEAHRTNPSGIVELGSGMNIEANEIINQRLDNVKLAMNKRYFGRRGATIDFRALTRNVPGGVVLMDDINHDVKIHETNDVTSSSYNEQDRITLDFDDIVGSFSPGSVQANRKLNETVGGMELLSDDSNTLSEYQLRVFSESWVEPTLKQVAAMIREYESDESVIMIAGDRAKIWDQVQEINEEMLTSQHAVRVAVGFGATSPQKRIEKLTVGLSTIASFLPNEMAKAKPAEIINEIFGALGHKGGERFFSGLGESEQQSPEVQQAMAQVEELTAMVQELQGQIQTKQVEAQSKLQVADINNQAKIEIERMRIDSRMQVEQMQNQLDYIDKQIAAEKNQLARGELELQKQTLVYQMKLKEVELLRADSDSMSGLLMRDQYGMAPKAEG